MILGSHIKGSNNIICRAWVLRTRLTFVEGKDSPSRLLKVQSWHNNRFFVEIDTVLLFFTFFFLSLCFSFSMFRSPIMHVLLSYYIPPSVFHPHHTRVGWVRGISFCPIQHLLELPMGSCKAASLLFRYHLHINVARELVERQLMRRQLQSQIFVCIFFLTLGLLSHLQW